MATQNNNIFLNPQNTAFINKNIVLNYIRHHGPVSRTDIWHALSLSRATVTLIIRQLMESGLVAEAEMGISSGGRKPCMLTALLDARAFLSFSWYTKALSISDLTPRLIYTVRLNFPENITPEQFCEVVSAGVDKIKSVHSDWFKRKLVLGAGFAMPGFINPHNNEVIMSRELGWNNVKLGEMLEEKLNIPVHLNRYTNMHALGECRYGSGGKSENFLLYGIYKGSVGISTIANSEIVYGSDYMSGEIGHTPVDKSENAPVCSCGRKGCLCACTEKELNERADGWQNRIAEFTAQALVPVINTLNTRILSIYIGHDDTDGLFEAIKAELEKNTSCKLTVKQCRMQPDSIELGLCSYMYNINFPELKVYEN